MPNCRREWSVRAVATSAAVTIGRAAASGRALENPRDLRHDGFGQERCRGAVRDRPAMTMRG
jgi:hypothetical protein